MAVHERTLDLFETELAAPVPPTWARPDQVDVVTVDIGDPREIAETIGRGVELADHLAAVVVGMVDCATPEVRPDDALPCDVVVTKDSEDLDRIVSRVHARPICSTAFVQILRGAPDRSIDDALLLESAVYSTLQAGPEFARWRESRPRRPRSPMPDPPVLVERDGSVLRIVLNRPDVHNALDAAMRDGLLEALQIALLDGSIDRVELSGSAPSFCSGGDLDEFGSFDDPASAHLVRTNASIGRLLHGLRDVVHVRLRGACVGSGIELPAFVADVRAGDDVRIALPELGLGLVPGAGGTWSLPQRIGRHRTAWLALTGATIDRSTAATWRLTTDSDRP